MDLSVIISTWNNSSRLAITLDALLNCQIPEGLNWEVVVVNNNCNDKTDAVISKFISRLPISYVKEPRQGLSLAKNKGLKEAKGKFVLFTDDDVKPCAQWIKIYWQAYKTHPRQTFFGGPVESDFEASPNPELLKVAPYSVKGFNIGKKMRFLDDKNFISANWGCEADILKELGGFDTRKGLNASSKLVTGEEVDLMKRLKRLGWKALYLPDASLKHFVPASKCSLVHIASRVEAFSFEKMFSSCMGHKENILKNVPMVTKTFARSLIRICVDNFKGKKESIGYIQWRRSIGYLKGMKESLSHE
jgi:glycosyltransferase involved in cell wall biosynthesis